MQKRDVDLDRLRQTARARAYRRLAIEYQDRFDVLHDEERVAIGLQPVQRKLAAAS